MVGIVTVVRVATPVKEIFFEVVNGRKIAEVPVAAGKSELGMVVVSMAPVNFIPPVNIRVSVRILSAV